MTIPERNVTIKGVFAENATTTIPQTPVAGTSYRDATTTQSEMNAGFPFKTIVDSSKFNEALYEYSAITKMQEKYGFVPWSNLTDYETGSFCLATDGMLYQALQASGPSSSAINPVNDTSATYWKKITVGSVRNIGELVKAIVPISDASLHLLDGSLLSGSGIYAGFVTYMAGLVSGYPNAFTTEAAWQSSVSTYGVCGKFVYDSTNNTIRLPLITGFIEGTTNTAALGDLVAAGLPNITGSFNGSQLYDYSTGSVADPYADGAFQVGGSQSKPTPNSSQDYSQDGFSFDASRSNAIYGNSNTVQPQSIKALYYIVIASTVKTDIEIDIDEIVTDLNGKVDKNELQTVYPIVETWTNGAAAGYRLWSDGYCEQWGVVGSSTTTATVNLLVPYNGIDFVCYANDVGFGPYAISIDRTSSSTITIASSGANFGAYWSTRGYIAQGN